MPYYVLVALFYLTWSIFDVLLIALYFTPPRPELFSLLLV